LGRPVLSAAFTCHVAALIHKVTKTQRHKDNNFVAFVSW
jgi:hypothetical protein